MDGRMQLAIKASMKAGDVLRQHFGKKYTIDFKSRRELVTEVDLKSEKAILSMLKSAHPDYNILSEEKGRENLESEYTWIVDPLDGTTNYTIGNPFFNTTIALAKGREVLLGCVYAPMTGEMFHAEKGKGAFLNGRRLRVSVTADMKRCLLAFCYGFSQADTERIIRMFGSLIPAARGFTQMRAAALELAFVAAGRLEGFAFPGARPWDVAAGSLLVKEAGGRVTDFSGNEWRLGADNKCGDLLASNGKIHEEALVLIGSKQKIKQKNEAEL